MLLVLWSTYHFVYGKSERWTFATFRLHIPFRIWKPKKKKNKNTNLFSFVIYFHLLINCISIVNRRLDEWVEEARLDFSKIEVKSAEAQKKEEADSSVTQVNYLNGNLIVVTIITNLLQTNARTRLKKRQYDETNNIQKVNFLFTPFPFISNI